VTTLLSRLTQKHMAMLAAHTTLEIDRSKRCPGDCRSHAQSYGRVGRGCDYRAGAQIYGMHNAGAACSRMWMPTWVMVALTAILIPLPF